MSFELEKKSMMAKLKKRRKFERNLVSHFDGRLEKFDRIQGYEHLEDEGTEGQEEDEKDVNLQEKLFYSWECLSLIKNNDTTLDIVI